MLAVEPVSQKAPSPPLSRAAGHRSSQATAHGYGSSCKHDADFPASTRARQLIENLTSLTRMADVRALATLPAEESRRLKDLRDRRRNLEAADHKRRAHELTFKIRRLPNHSAHISRVASCHSVPPARTCERLEASMLPDLLGDLAFVRPSGVS